MKRRKLFLILVVCILNVYVPKINALEEYYPYLETKDIEELKSIKASHILLLNLNDQKIVYEKNPQERIKIASLTKIMTAIVAILNTKNLEEQFTIPEYAFYESDGYAEAGFKIGDAVTIKDLLYGTLLPSGVEAAQSLALYTMGSIDAFVMKMNELATLLDMQNTHFDNPVGRDSEENYSTLYDLEKLLLFALQDETFYEIYTTRNYTATNGLNFNSTLVKPSEKYHLNIEKIKGAKSGYTKEAGLCLASIAEKEGIEYLLLTANSPYENGYPNHIVDSLNIYTYFFDNYSYIPILKPNQELATLNIIDSQEKELTVDATEEVSLYLKKDMVEKLEYDYEGIEILNSKIKPMDKLGDFSIKYEDNILYTHPIYLNENITYRHTQEVLLFFGGLFFFFFLIFMLRWRKEKSSEHARISKSIYR